MGDNSCQRMTDLKKKKGAFKSILRTHIPLVNISAGFCDALQALADDRHHMLLRVGEQAVALAQFPAPPLVQILQFLKGTRRQLYRHPHKSCTHSSVYHNRISNISNHVTDLTIYAFISFFFQQGRNLKKSTQASLSEISCN